MASTPLAVLQGQELQNSPIAAAALKTMARAVKLYALAAAAQPGL